MAEVSVCTAGKGILEWALGVMAGDAELLAARLKEGREGVGDSEVVDGLVEKEEGGSMMDGRRWRVSTQMARRVHLLRRVNCTSATTRAAKVHLIISTDEGKVNQ